MAQYYKGEFTTNASEGRSLTFWWGVDSTSIEGNYKKIAWKLYGSGSASGFVMAGDFKVVIDGVTVYNSSNRIELWKDTVVASGTVPVHHDTQGNKTLTASVEASIYEYAIDNKGSGSWELQTIPRYANITSFSVSPIDETSVKYSWTADATCDYAWYSTDNGSTWNALPNSNVIGGLSVGTSYNFKLRVRRKDSQLTTDSSAYVQSTYNYPHCTSSPNFTIGDALTLDFYNPLGRSISVYGYSKKDGSEIFTGNTNGTRLVGFNDENSVNKQYASIPNSKDSEYTVVVVYNDTPMTRDAGNVYQIRGNETPTINGFDYIDVNKPTIAVTGNNRHIVQNLSVVLVRFHSATANKGAGGISQYYIECNGKKVNGKKEGSYDLGYIDSERDVDLTLTAVDSRGLSASKTIKVTVFPHSRPNATVELQRLNNYEDETYLTVDGSISSVNEKNTMTIKYRYKVSGGDYGEYSVIGDREKQTLSLDKNNVHIVEVTVTDAFGSFFVGEYVVGKGVFPLYIDTVKNSVSINKFPVYDKSFEASGLISLGERNAFELEVGKSIEIPIFLSLCSGMVNFRIAGANLEVARLFYVFRSNQYFGLHKTLIDESYGNTSAVVPMEMRNAEEGYMFKITNNHSSPVFIRYGIFELC